MPPPETFRGLLRLEEDTNARASRFCCVANGSHRHSRRGTEPGSPFEITRAAAAFITGLEAFSFRWALATTKLLMAARS
jgi:hypothetical protein